MLHPAVRAALVNVLMGETLNRGDETCTPKNLASRQRLQSKMAVRHLKFVHSHEGHPLIH